MFSGIARRPSHALGIVNIWLFRAWYSIFCADLSGRRTYYRLATLSGSDFEHYADHEYQMRSSGSVEWDLVLEVEQVRWVVWADGANFMHTVDSYAPMKSSTNGFRYW
jgi:hypothetical protein